MITAIRQTEKILVAFQQHTVAENELYRIARRSLVAAVKIPAGTKITEDMIAVKGPVSGFRYGTWKS